MTNFSLFMEPLDEFELRSWTLPSPIDCFINSASLFPHQSDLSDLSRDMDLGGFSEMLAISSPDDHPLPSSPITSLSPSSTTTASPSSWSSFPSPASDSMDSSGGSNAEECVIVQTPPISSSTSSRNRKQRSREQVTNKKPTSSDTASLSHISKERKRGKGAIPHSVVETRYRNSLNASMEKVRLAVPHLTQLDPASSSSRPSKGAILANAVAYIKNIEKERDRFKDENEFLRGIIGSPASVSY